MPRVETVQQASRERPGAPEAVLRRALDEVAGFMTEGELALLHRLASQSRGTVVELGAFHGRSTVALCLGARQAGVGVITVDAFTPIGETFGLGPDAPEEALRENLAAFGFAPRIIPTLSWEAAGQVEGPVGLLFHDAGHTREAVERALAAWESKLADDAVVVLHDYDNEQWPEVRPTADAWAAAHGWQKADGHDWLQAFRRG